MGPIILNAGICKVIKYSYWDKRTRTHLPLAQNVFNFKLCKASGTTFNILASIIGHKHTKQTNKQTKNNTPIKEKN
jgi:hypothetical protein